MTQSFWCNTFVNYRNCNIDACGGYQRRTSLIIAAYRNHVTAVRILLENNADMEVKDTLGNQPIHVAADSGSFEYVIQLLSH